LEAIFYQKKVKAENAQLKPTAVVTGAAAKNVKRAIGA